MIHPEIFENIDKVIEYLINSGWTLSKSYIRNAPYEVMNYGNNKIVYYPQPLFSPKFRGQNELYSPCVSSFFRSQPDLIDQFILRLKIEEFRLVTSKHPVIKEDMENGVYFDYIALAQHYEFKTEMLDFTNSLPVAAFFAVTRHQDNGKYIPINSSEKPGVLYFISPHMECFPSMSEEQLEIFPVGWQVYKRPGEQRAFGVKFNNKDFNQAPGVFAYRFWHDKNISEQIYNMFHQGEDLFPKDIFAEKAAKIKNSNIFSDQAYNITCESTEMAFSREKMLVELKKRNIIIQKDSIWEYTDEEISILKAYCYSGALTENLHATTRLCYTSEKDEG